MVGPNLYKTDSISVLITLTETVQAAANEVLLPPAGRLCENHSACGKNVGRNVV